MLLNLGYALLWIIFAVARERPYRPFAIVFFHVATMFVALVTMSEYQYFKVTGSMLDLDFILFSVSSSEGLGDVVASEVSMGLQILILAVLAYVLLGPWLIMRLVVKWRKWSDVSDERATKPPWFRAAAASFAAYTLFSFSLLPGGGGKYRRPEQVLFAGLLRQHGDGRSRGGRERELSGAAADPAAGESPPEASLRATVGTERRSVVLVHLESTRA